MHIVITGASSGIGAALARAFGSDASHRLTLVARRRAAMEALADELPARTQVVTADLSRLSTDWLDEAEKTFGAIDVLVNNAGVQVLAPTHEVDIDVGERSLRLNLHAPLRAIRAVLPGMRARGFGRIVNVTSMAALTPTPGMTYYNASKAGLAAASEALRHELRGTGVTVTTVYPSIIVGTEMAETGLEAFEGSLLLRLQPRVTADDLAAVVVRDVLAGRPRRVYPRPYAATRWLGPLAQWVVGRFAPPLRSDGSPSVTASAQPQRPAAPRR